MIFQSRAAYANALYNGSGLVPESKLKQNIISVISGQISLTTNKPTGKDVVSIDTWGAGKNTIKHISSTHNSLGPGGISITFVGETHGLAKDNANSALVINNHSNADIIFYERGLHNGFGGVYAGPLIATNTVREEDITQSYGINWGVNNFGVSPGPRDLVVAGFLVLCVASGDQDMAVKIIMLCGENHVGVLHQFNEIAYHAAPWLIKRKRLLHFVKSSDSNKMNKWGISEN